MREQCAWVYQGDEEGATEKALALIRNAEARVKAAEEKFSELCRDADRIAFSRVYVLQWDKLPSLINVQAEMLDMIGPPTGEEIKKAEEGVSAAH